MIIAVATAARIGRKAALMLALAATAATSLPAQTVADDQVPAAGLDLPENLQIFGKMDPNVRKPTAIVNDAVITATDVDQRVALAMALNPEMRLTPEQKNQLRLQILRQVIDETLQIQAAADKTYTIDAKEIDKSFASVARNLRKASTDELRSWLREIGSSERALKRQIEAELAWQRLLRRRVAPLIAAGEEEAQAYIKTIEDAKGTEEFELKEIYIRATPDRADEVRDKMQAIVEQMRQGERFETLAIINSQSTTRATGGDLGWVRAATLPQSFQDALQQMKVGTVVGPVEAPGGYSLLYLTDKRQVLMADPRDAKLSLRQLSIQFPQGTTEAQASDLAAKFAEATQAMKGCGDVAATAKAVKADVVDDDSKRIRDLPPALGDILLNMQVGEATRPFGSIEEGVRVLVLCGRDDPQGAGMLPTVEQVQEQMTEERVNKRADRMLRDLRRDALIEYR